MNLFLFRSGFIIPFHKNREGQWGRPIYFKQTSYLTLEDLESHDKERCISQLELSLLIISLAVMILIILSGMVNYLSPNNWLEEIIEQQV